MCGSSNKLASDAVQIQEDEYALQQQQNSKISLCVPIKNAKFTVAYQQNLNGYIALESNLDPLNFALARASFN